MKSNTNNNQLSNSLATANGGARCLGRCRGFTLIELMITLLVAAILMAIAIPSFTYMTVSSKLTAAANDVISAAGSGRMEAIKRNARVAVNPNGDFAVTLDSDGTVIRAGLPDFNPPIMLSKSAKLTYTPEGLAVDAANTPISTLVASITSNAISSDNARCIYIITGSALRSCTATVAANVDCPADPCVN